MALAVGTRIDPPEGGESTTNGTGGRTITFSTAMPDTDYHVSVMPIEAQQGGLGETWIEKGTDSFVFYNDGAAGIEISWTATRY